MSSIKGLNPVRNFINGEWLSAEHYQTIPLFNPSTGEVIGSVPMSTPDISNQAVKAAAEAYPAWSATPLPKRMDYIFKIVTAMQENLEQLAYSVALDQGKHISEARGEVSRVIEIVQMTCSVPTLLQGETIQGIANNINGRVIKAPLGVFCGVAPFNFPALVFG